MKANVTDNHYKGKISRLESLDMLKAIAMMMVVALHTPIFTLSYSEMNINFVVNYFVRLICEGVPIFLFVTGFLLFSKNEFDYKKHYKKTLKTFMFLIFWSILLVYIRSCFSKEKIELFSLFKYVFDTKLGSKYTGVLWYLIGLIAFYLIFPMLKICYDYNFDLFKWIFFILFAFTGFYKLLNIVKDVMALRGPIELYTVFLSFYTRFNPFGNTIYLYYPCLGGVVSKYQDYLKNKKCLSYLFVVLHIVTLSFCLWITYKTNKVYSVNINYNQPVYSLIIISYFVLLSNMKNTNIISSFIKSVGRNTMGIYLLHPVFIDLVNSILKQFGYDQPYNAILRIIMFIIVFVCSYLSTLLINKIPYVRETIKI